MLSKNLLITYSSWIFYLLPFSLLTGPFLPDLSISIIGIIFLYIAISNKDYKYFNNVFSKVFLAFYIYLIINSIVSDYTLFSLKSTLVYFRFGIFSLAVWYLLDNNKNLINTFLLFLIGAFCLGFLAGTYQSIFSENIFGFQNPSKVHFRLLLLTSDNAVLGQFFARLMPLLIGLLILRKTSGKMYYFLFFSLFVTTDVFIFISGERTALGLLTLSSIFILIFIKQLRLFRLSTVASSILIIFFISIYFPSIKERHIDQTINQLGLNNTSEKINIISIEHENMIITSWEMFKDNITLGIGANNYRNLCNESDYKNRLACSTHPHNNYIQVLAELGIVGLIFLFYLNFYIIQIVLKDFYNYYIYKNNNLSDYQICLIACFVSNLWPLFPTLNLFNNWINIIYYLPVGFYLHSIYLTKDH